MQTVHRETNPHYWALLEAFKAKTGCPVLVNTSFNVRGEPIVCTPTDAFRCFMGTDLDCLAIGNCFLRKTAQNPALRHAHAEAFEGVLGGAEQGQGSGPALGCGPGGAGRGGRLSYALCST